MKVIAAINGSLIAEHTAFLALTYAKEQAIDLVLLHVKNHKDSLDAVKKSAEEIEQRSLTEGVACELVILSGHPSNAIKTYLSTIHTDTFFCTTRSKGSFLVNSFSEKLLKLKLDTDIAIVRIVKLHSFKTLDSILLPIRQSKLSVKKFAFLATLASAYQSNAQIYSLTMASRNALSKFDISTLRDRFGLINFELRHYVNLSRLMPFDLHIKHEFSHNEIDSIVSHIAKSDCQLVVIGAKRLSFMSLFKGEKPMEALFRQTSENLIAYYPKES